MLTLAADAPPNLSGRGRGVVSEHNNVHCEPIDNASPVVVVVGVGLD